jgi:tetratricopeptide (TPR) repeat protein
MIQKVFALIMIATILFLYSCEVKTENELYQDIMSIDKTQERVNELVNFLDKYPENKNKDKILRRLFRDYVSLKDEANAVTYAEKYINYFPKDYSMSQLNEVAWVLAENNLCLKSAKVFADRAVEQARETDTRTLNGILDTQAYVYFQAGEAKKALALQLEAMAGNENSYDFLSRLGLYQHGAGELENSYKTIAKSILLGGGLDLGILLRDWLSEDIK